jgi:hypothetical protein
MISNQLKISEHDNPLITSFRQTRRGSHDMISAHSQHLKMCRSRKVQSVKSLLDVRRSRRRPRGEPAHQFTLEHISIWKLICWIVSFLKCLAGWLGAEKDCHMLFASTICSNFMIEISILN